jgi:hypothetical protein
MACYVRPTRLVTSGMKQGLGKGLACSIPLGKFFKFAVPVCVHLSLGEQSPSSSRVNKKRTLQHMQSHQLHHISSIAGANVWASGMLERLPHHILTMRDLAGEGCTVRAH